MRKILFMAIVLMVIQAVPLFSQTAEDVAEEIITELTLEFRRTHPDMMIKPNVAVLTVDNQSPSAREYEVGPAFTAIIYSLVQRSMVFNLVDVDLRDTMIEEMKFALTGLAESEDLDPGKIKLIDYFLQGSVTELGEDLRLTLNLVQVETGEVVLSANGILPKELVIQASQDFTAAYVSPYGLGIELSLLPWAYLYGDTVDREGQPHPNEFGMFSIMLHYRIRKWLVAWGGLELAPGALRFEDSYNEGEGVFYSASEMQNVSGALPDGNYHYVKHRSPYFSLHLGAGWVWNITRTLNITLGGELSMAQTFLVQEYNMPSTVDPSGNSTHVIESNDISLWILSPTAKIQFFLTPRVAVNLAYKFKYQLPSEDGGASTYSFQDGTYGDGSPIPQLYNLNPALDPEGREHFTDLTGHTASIGMGFYF